MKHPTQYYGDCGLWTVDCRLWRLWSTSPSPRQKSKILLSVNVPPWEQNLPAHLHTSSSFTSNHNWESKIPAHLFTKSLAPAGALPLWSPSPLEPTSPPTKASH